MVELNSKRSVAKTAFALVIVSFLLSTSVSLLSLHIMSERNMREMNKVLATQVYDYISSELSKPIIAARTMSSNSFLVNALDKEDRTDASTFTATMSEYLAGIERDLGYQSTFVVSDATKKYYTRDGLNRIIDPLHDEEDDWYTAFAEGKAHYDLNVNADEKNSSDLNVYVNVKIENGGGDFLGICGLGVRMVGIQELFRNFEQLYGVRIDLVDDEGIVQVDTNRDYIGTLDLSEMVAGKKSGEYIYNELGGGRFAVTKYVEDMDWFLVVQSDGPNEAGQFVNIIILNVALCLLVLVSLFVALRINRRRTNELASASLVDHLTKLLNKRAFERDMAALSTQALDADLVCATVDVNGLKTVNDTIGHKAGDELIEGAADCLRSCFARYGKVYRIGGDEFSALLYVPEGALEPLKQEFDQAVSSWSGASVGNLAVSCGYASAREFPTETVAGLVSISDKRMYEDKDRYYASKGLERRKT